MTGPDVEAVTEALTGVIDPEIRRNIVELDMVDDISIDGGSVTVTVLLTIAGCPLKDTITKGHEGRGGRRRRASPRWLSCWAR
jgi:ATP-binding protein involved in chromosome partitioning